MALYAHIHDKSRRDVLDNTCPICSTQLSEQPRKVPDNPRLTCYPCPNCGPFAVNRPSEELLKKLARDDPLRLRVLSYIVRKMKAGESAVALSRERIMEITDSTKLPSPTEQIANLLLWIGNNSEHFGKTIHLSPEEHTAVVGAIGTENFFHITSELVNQGLFEGMSSGRALFEGHLTLAGWEAYERLKRGRHSSRKAFMAMEYGDDELDVVFHDCFKPAVAAAGFSLERLDEDPPSGLIDNRLRVEILKARFLVADLTLGNHGAYWEAGYAEGLGRPVIFTCRKSYAKEHGTHFDTNHMHTVFWESTDLQSAGAALTATIRASFPAEARLEDLVNEESVE